MIHLRMKLLFDVDADHLKMIPLTLEITKRAKLQQAASVNLCNPMIPWGSLKPSVENACAPTPWL